VVFTLYVAGKTPRSIQAAANLNRFGRERLGGAYDLTVIDVAAEPERAEAARILTTPTLVKEAPGQTRRVTGDLSDAERVFVALGL
jgi:circadian clock protein KaiB